MLARVLAAAGVRVSMVCMNYGQPARTTIDGIEVIRAHAPVGGLPGLRFLHPRMTSVWSAMQQADADVYYQRSCGALTGIVAAFCRTKRKIFMYAAAHDADFDPRLPLIRLGRDRALYTWGLRKADAIIVQSPVQRSRCLDSFGLPSRHIPSCYAPPSTARRDPNGYVLWVSTMRAWKQPEEYMALAERLPQFRFRMVGGPEDANYYQELRRRAATLANLDFVGFVPYTDIDRQFDGARLFINTSTSEGFPNTFLQSWARSIATVSFFDPGSRSDGKPVTEVARDRDDMVRLVAELMTDDDKWIAACARSRKAFVSEHSPDRIGAAYLAVLNQLAPSG
jgi:glycosyltransferase involved in cell wall biosynthesis